MGKSTITFYRKTTLSRLRSFLLLVDNVRVSEINHDERVVVEVAAGNHDICVKIDWLKSNILSINSNEDENIEILINEPERSLFKYLALIVFLGFMFGVGTMICGLIGASICGGIAGIIIAPYLLKPLISRI